MDENILLPFRRDENGHFCQHIGVYGASVDSPSCLESLVSEFLCQQGIKAVLYDELNITSLFS